jgi:cephalosporin hydroxylase
VDLPDIAQSSELFKEPVVARFHEFYRKSNPEGPLGPPWLNYRGYNALKFPTDLWIYQEIISKNNITGIFENGVAGGGTSLYLADMCEVVGRGMVVSTDIDLTDDLPTHKRLSYNKGDTLKRDTLDGAISLMYTMSGQNGQRLLILDDGHSYEHVEAELRLWTPILISGDILIVEDTDLGGPYWGLQRFMRDQPDNRWERMEWCEKFSLTQNPMGYWRCK